jgi:hypothetical protein
MLDNIGTLIKRFLVTLFTVNLAIVLFQFMVLESITLDECLQRIILFMIPTEVTILEKLAAFPIAAIIVLIFYLNHVKYARD